MIYLDNAATGGFKPNSVIETASSAIKYLNANAGRSGHRLSKTASGFVYSCRKKLSNFFNNGKVENVIFTKNCSEALNIAIYGLTKSNTHVITTCFEHNSVLRPLFTLEKNKVITLSVISPSNGKYLTARDVETAFTPNTKLVIVNHVSNVTGDINDVKDIGNFLKNTNATFVVDGAQSGGHVKIDMTELNVDVLALAGHKGLYGIQGSGVLIFKDGIQIDDTFQGGTGTESFNPLQPSYYPEKLEIGTLNVPAICSLEEGVRYIESSIDYLSVRLTEMSKYLIDRLSLINNVKIYSTPNPVGIVAFSVDGVSSIEVAERLSDEFDVAVRGGFHCAPLMHKFLKTEDDGLVRASICPYNTKRDIYILCDAVKTIALS